jgi:hypothetical protein
MFKLQGFVKYAGPTHFCCNLNVVPMTNKISSVMLRPKRLEIRNKNE